MAERKARSNAPPFIGPVEADELVGELADVAVLMAGIRSDGPISAVAGRLAATRPNGPAALLIALLAAVSPDEPISLVAGMLREMVAKGCLHDSAAKCALVLAEILDSVGGPGDVRGGVHGHR